MRYTYKRTHAHRRNNNTYSRINHYVSRGFANRYCG